MPLKQLMKLPDSSNIHPSPKQSLSKLGSLLMGNCNAESVFVCPTRWTVRADAMISVISHYSVLHELWDWSLDNCTVTEMKAQVRGEQIHMHQFQFIFGLVLGRNLLQHTANLSMCACNKSRFLQLKVNP